MLNQRLRLVPGVGSDDPEDTYLNLPKRYALRMAKALVFGDRDEANAITVVYCIGKIASIMASRGYPPEIKEWFRRIAEVAKVICPPRDPR